MIDPQGKDQIRRPMTMGLAIFIVVFIVTFLTKYIVAPLFLDYPWGRALNFGAGILMTVLVVSFFTMQFFRFIKRRRQERRDRAERDAGLM